MDATTLRIVLIVLGAFFLVALYLWERRRMRDEEDYDDGYDDEPAQDGRREPSIGIFGRGRRSAPADADWLDDKAGQGEDADGADGGGLIVQLYVVALGAPFAGDRLLGAAARHGLVPGDRGIFQRRKVEGASHVTLFGMANLVAPGTFPFDGMDAFSTRGVALFAQLDGAPSDLMIFDEMVRTASALADELDGELQRKDRAPLTDSELRRMRGEVTARLQGEPG